MTHFGMMDFAFWHNEPRTQRTESGDFLPIGMSIHVHENPKGVFHKITAGGWAPKCTSSPQSGGSQAPGERKRMDAAAAHAHPYLGKMFQN